MNCPSEIAEVLLKILAHGLLRIRAAGWSGAGDRCALEADHLHNLPGLLTDFSFDRLRYYWEGERPAFLQRSGEAEAAGFEPLWQKLQRSLSPSTAQAVD
jgi:hypothetical protein